MFKRKNTEPTPAAQKLLEECANDYANRAQADPFSAAEQQTGQTINIMAAQRAANRTWGDNRPAGDE